MGVWKSGKKNSSVEIAKDRLRAVLVSDRTDCTPETFDRIKQELFRTISKYMDIAPGEFQVQISRTDMHITFTGEES